MSVRAGTARKPYHHGALREALLLQAFKDLESVGLEGISLRGLAEETGVSKTAPYRHFADKRELLVTLAADGFRLLAEALEAVPPQGIGAAPPPREEIRALVRAYVDFAKARPALYRLMISRLGFELHSEACRLNSQRALARLARAVAAAQASGWRSGHDSLSVVLSVWAAAHGWATFLIDSLLPPGISPDGDDWLSAAQVLLE